MTTAEFRLLDTDRLADECAEHTAKFFHRAVHDPGYCFELFRRAIVWRNSYAWGKIYNQYKPLVGHWVKLNSGLDATGEDVDFFVNCAFDRLWTSMDAAKFNEFDNLSSLLRYFQLCVNSTIVDHLRKHQHPTLDMEEIPNPSVRDMSSVEEEVTEELESHRLSQMALSLMQDEKERLVLRCSFVYDLKPSEIYALYPQRFEDIHEVYRIKRNVLNRLRRHPAMRQFLLH
jgi:RNA polymerase sigma factor (sigma-70 family)